MLHISKPPIGKCNTKQLKCQYISERDTDRQHQLLPPAKTAAEQRALGRLDEAIQSLRPATDNEDHVQRIEIEIRTKEMEAQHTGPSEVPL